MADLQGPRIVVDGLVAGYGPPARTPDVLHGVDLDVGPGEVTAVVGPNGAGKSTLFRSLLGFLSPRAGRVSIGGRTPGRHRARSGFGYLPEAVVPPRGWTARDWVRSAATLRSAPDPASDVATMLDAMGVGAHATSRLERLSRGTVRRVALAFVLAGAPTAVLLDEPLAALDAPARAHVREAVADLRRRGTTVLVATHELPEVPRLAQRALVVSAGRIIARLRRPDPRDMEALILAAGGGP